MIDFFNLPFDTKVSVVNKVTMKIDYYVYSGVLHYGNIGEIDSDYLLGIEPIYFLKNLVTGKFLTYTSKNYKDDIYLDENKAKIRIKNINDPI